MTQCFKSPLDVDLQVVGCSRDVDAGFYGRLHPPHRGLVPRSIAVFGPATASRGFRVLREVGSDTLDLELSAVHRHNGFVGKANRPVRLTWPSKKVLP